jgi:hypothetical protein
MWGPIAASPMFGPGRERSLMAALAGRIVVYAAGALLGAARPSLMFFVARTAGR